MLRPAFILLLIIAAIGLISCTVFLGMVAWAARRHRRRYPVTSARDDHPLASLLKPLCGLEPHLEENLESFFVQNDPVFELIFAMQDASDPALAVLRRVQQRHPNVAIQVVFSGPSPWPSAKVWSLEKMVSVAHGEYLVISDSDVKVAPNYVREVISPLADPNVGLVTCFYRGVPTGGLWSRLEALGMSVEMTSGVVVADMMEGMRFALGPTMALRRDVLAKIGGFPVLADYYADDYVLGNEVSKAGYTVVISGHVIEHIVLNHTFRSSLAHQVRWMRSTRFSRPAGHIGTGLTFAMPFGIIGCIAAAGLGHPWIGLALLLAAVLNRVALALVSGWGVVRDSRARRDAWLYPLRDLMGFGFWAASFFSDEISWRGRRFRFSEHGRMLPLNGGSGSQSSRPVAINDLS
jgi:ceramide glucosyltransferase